MSFSRRIRNLFAQRQQNADAEQHARQEHGQPSRPDEQVRPIVYTVRIEPGSEDEQHRSNERDYWRRQLREGKYLNIFTATAAIFAFFGLLVLSKTLKETSRATDAATDAARASQTQAVVAQRQLEVAERPWVSADISILNPVRVDKDGAHMTVRFSLKNSGRSVAGKVRIEAKFFTLPQFVCCFPIRQQVDMCEPLRGNPPDAPGWYDTIFPGQEKPPLDFPLDMAPEDLRILEDPITIGKPVPLPMLVGCIDYQFMFAPGHHQTQFAFNLSGEEVNKLKPTSAPVVLNPGLQTFPFTGNDAD